MTTTSDKPTIGGEEVSIGDFSAFKAIFAMEIVTEVEGAFRQVLSETAAFKRQYEKENVVEIPRAEARRQFRPKPLYKARQIIADDGETIEEVVEEPVIDEKTGEPVLGPDPLAHLTDQDWQASGNMLRLADSPGDDVIFAQMIPTGFKLARAQVLRLIALALTTNRELEEWDGQGSETIAGQLDQKGKKLLHQARADELVRLAVAVARKCKDQLGGPFDEAAAAFRELRPSKQQQTEEPTAPEQQPVSVETEGEPSAKPTSSTESPAATGGRQTSSSTASRTGG